MTYAWTLAAMAALIGTAAGAAGATVIIDDFATGPAHLAMSAKPSRSESDLQVQSGAMAGGSRIWTLLLRGAEALGGVVDVTPQGFELQTDPGVFHRIDLLYGDTRDDRPPMRLDLSGENTLRFSFDAVPSGVNFNVLTYFRGEVDNYAQIGKNLLPTPGPTNLDFSFADIAGRIADPTRPADFSWVSHIYVVSQSGGFVNTGGEGFRLAEISAVSAVPEPGVWMLLSAGMASVAVRRRLMRSR